MNSRFGANRKKGMILTNMYNLFIMSLYVLLFCLIKVASSISMHDFLAKFDKNGCIEGSILDMGQSGQITELVEEDTSTTEENETRDKIPANPLSTVHLLALYNKLIYHYYLENEEGPSHNRIFTVLLTLGEEKYSGTGSSIKEAKKAAATEALSKTSYLLPPAKTRESENMSTPTVQLNSFAYKLGLKVTYLAEDELKDGDMRVMTVKTSLPDVSAKSSYHNRLNTSAYNPYAKNYGLSKADNAKSPFVVAVVVGEQKFIGTGYTKQAARHDAAAKALEALKKMSNEEKEHCLADGSCDREKIKSPISLVYEYAQQKQLNLEYKLIKEEGPAHEREYVTQCILGELSAEGTGHSKKKSKQNASENMLAQLKSFEPEATNTNSQNSIQKKKKKRRNKVIRGVLNKFAQDAKDLLTSTLDYLAPTDNNNDQISKDSILNNKNKNQDKGDSGESTNFKELLLEVTQERGISVHYSDLFKEDSKYFSLLQIGLHPNYVCLGDGQSFEEARTKASMEAIHFLHKMGLENLRINKVKSEETIWTKTHDEVCAFDENLQVDDDTPELE